ncbi:hypothetical protein AUR04nite_10040 [Glutamicibacter uratoxydans]|uniref:Uncharacterized protein n=1 Tax=Glutamicibacter uratoxydans TaxID=43667 RepID=A0A4Y4DJL4_GLUUR|nr:hypothetical protein [Glutamicibacter uratoxydans]GED05472.1 hypothetical protein AUR04nite_10040 [Glutamicibacter uratoxydans]
MYIRFQSPKKNHRGIHVGIFGLANSLGNRGLLSEEEHRLWRSMNDWYNAAYPDPTAAFPEVYDDDVNPGAVAWFKSTAVHLLEKIPPYLQLLDRYGVDCELVTSDDPGKVVYEDEFQIVVVPREG